MPLLSAQITDGIINPPTMTDAFVHREYGDPGVPGSGLVVVAMHAVRSGEAPGNAVENVIIHAERQGDS